MGDSSIEQRLNPDGAGSAAGSAFSGSKPDIEVDPDLLDRISASAGDVHDGLRAAGKLADESTADAGSALANEGFDLGAALRKAGAKWEGQTETLLLACEKVREGLAATADGHRLVEERNEMTIAEIAKHFE
ncbi:hypothetical protein ACOQFL_21280 [Actinopolyspora sp. H202]|uniref:hypothetical protein n=1 Tax=Actinopolyspora sp. H202 TaxID=1500456 RepID=UPI003EE7F522